jgi:hypothetical protein
MTKRFQQTVPLAGLDSIAAHLDGFKALLQELCGSQLGLQNAFKTIALPNATMADAFKDIQLPNAIVADAFKDIALPNATVADAFKDIAELNAAMWEEANRAFAEAFQNADPQRVDEALKQAEILGSFGWTLPMGMTPRQYVWIVEQSSGGLAAADQAFLNYYTADEGSNCKRLMLQLLHNQTLQRWHGCLKEIDTAYEKGLYRVCIPTLLTILDGIAYHNWTTKFYSEDGRRKFLERKVQSARKGDLDEHIWRSVKAFVVTVFQSGVKSEPLVINRHWILHGRSAPNGTQADCLRLLQAVHTFASMVEDKL